VLSLKISISVKLTQVSIDLFIFTNGVLKFSRIFIVHKPVYMPNICL